MFGIKPKSFQLILETLAEFQAIEKAGVFGSRAVGTQKNGSDIDMVLFGSGINPDTILKLKTKLEQELPIPYYFDLVHYQSVKNSELKEHIDKYSRIFYTS